MTLDSGGRGSRSGRYYTGFPRSSGVRPTPDWPLSHEEKKRAALRLYDRDVRAADRLIRSGEEKCRELQLQLQAARTAKHDEEVAERLRLAIESATLALNGLLSAAGNGKKVGAGRCPTLEMVSPKKKALAAPARARSEGSADAELPRGGLRRNTGDTASRPPRRVSFSERRERLDRPSSSSSERAVGTGGDEPEPPDPLTPERSATAALTKQLESPVAGSGLSAAQRALMQQVSVPEHMQPWPPSMMVPGAMGQPLEWEGAPLDAMQPLLSPAAFSPMQFPQLREGAAPSRSSVIPPAGPTEEAPSALVAGVAALLEKTGATGSAGAPSPEQQTGPVCFSIATPRTPSDSPSQSPRATPRASDASRASSESGGPRDGSSRRQSQSSQPEPVSAGRRWMCQRGRGSRSLTAASSGPRGCTPPLQRHSRSRPSCPDGAASPTPRGRAPEAARPQSLPQPEVHLQRDASQEPREQQEPQVQQQPRRRRMSEPRRQDSAPQPASSRISDIAPPPRARGVQLFDPSQAAARPQSPTLALCDAGGGAQRARGVQLFDPSQPAAAPQSSALALHDSTGEATRRRAQNFL